ncbi:hypothetical protein FRC07_014217 [Ceratobasidium sp. 392]|nr:hypothetical protein FRC07_014217 [Ceratobasidium sp. 392]
MKFHISLRTVNKRNLGRALDSLTSSGDVLERIAAWSSHRDRGRLFAMKFHNEWRHEDCPVMRWYQQQCVSSTEFRSIEHRRSIEGPFYHEFLLLRLIDGAICRVERVGEGSRSDAIRSIGCAANDLIQWFAEDEYDKFSAIVPSVLIAKVDMGRTFDILDVLAACYSVQKTAACRVYTLQRYNCYFLCLAVLTVLTRRTACWEEAITLDTWDSVVSSALERLLSTREPEPAKHLILRICKILDPKNSQPENLILDTLRIQLDSRSGAPVHVNEALSKMLWWADYDSALHTGFEEEAQMSTKTILRSGGTCGDNLWYAVYQGHRDAESSIELEQALSKVYYKQLFEQVSQHCDQYRAATENVFRMLKMEHSISRTRALLLKMYAPVAVMIAGIRPDWALEQCSNGSTQANFFWQGVAPRHWTVSARASVAKMMASSDHIAIVQELGGFSAGARLRDEGFHSDGKHAFVDFMTRMLDTLEAEGMVNRPEVWHIIASQLSYKGLADTLNVFMVSILRLAINDLVQSKQPSFYVNSTSQGDSGQKLYSPSEFQEQYVRSRIRAHADRVAVHQLAAAPLVCRDIEQTIARVWISLPHSFGSIAETPAL